MYVTWTDFIQFGLLVVAIIGLVFAAVDYIDNKKK